MADPPERFVICGLLMGGCVAREVLRLAPQRVRSLVLMATSAQADTEEQTTLRQRLIAVGRERGIGSATDALLPRRLRAESPEKPALNARIRQMAIDIGQTPFERQQQVVIERRDQTATLGMIGVPTIIASGTDDRIIDPSVRKRWPKRSRVLVTRSLRALAIC